MGDCHKHYFLIDTFKRRKDKAVSIWIVRYWLLVFWSLDMTFEQFIQRFHIRLNDQQLTAVRSVEGPTLLLAVPGSGKTTVLVSRLGYMICCCGIAPENILTVTYTVAATRDMRNRFAALFGEELAGRLEFRTINGICAKIIQFYGQQLGKKAFDLVTDEGFKVRLIAGIYQKIVRDYPTESDLQTISTHITYIKNMQLSPEEIAKLGEKEELPILEIYQEYCRELRSRSLMDYDDQMMYASTMLRNPQVLEYFQNRYRYICVDEAQDTSKIQHRIIAQLASGRQNLFMVGDEDQSIYGFRAAYPQALLSFEKNYPQGRVLLMERNYRSNAQIVEAADRFIQKNELRHKKHMRPMRPQSSEIRIITLKNRKAQYSYLEKVAENCTTQTAVLYRDNESILPVIDRLERRNLPYRVKNADLTFFTHRIITDIRNIIHFAQNPCDTDSFMQIYYKIGTYLSKSAALYACQTSREKGLPVLEAALRFAEISNGTIQACKSMQTHLKGLLQESAEKALYRIVNFMGYKTYLERMHIKTGKLEILRAIADKEPSAQRLVGRLDELSTIIREKEMDFNCPFILSTIHSSKGLEYDTVYLMDAIDGIFPETVVKNRRQATDEEISTYEEERRLYYVGVTRAKDNLNIFDLEHHCTFSDELIGRAERKNFLKENTTSYAAPKNRKPVSREQYEQFLEALSSTDTVRHKVYGKGEIIELDGDSITIQFAEKRGRFSVQFLFEKKLVKPYP